MSSAAARRCSTAAGTSPSARRCRAENRHEVGAVPAQTPVSSAPTLFFAPSGGRWVGDGSGGTGVPQLDACEAATARSARASAPPRARPRGEPNVTRRRSSYRSLGSLQRDNGRCRACVEAGYPLESLPVVEGRPAQRAYILGQAPGIVEGEERRPWRGRAGATLRRWLAMDEEEFYATFYCAAVTRCYPGRAASGRGDRTPTPREQQLCAFWRDWELRLLRPRLIVPIGGIAIKRLLGVEGLAGCVGQRYEHDGATVVPLPHPSGASSWLNAPANRELVTHAVQAIHDELEALGSSDNTGG